MREWEIQIYWSEAIHNAEIVLAEWLEVAREDGIPIPKIKK